MTDVFEQMLKENQFVVLNFGSDQFIPLKVYYRQTVAMDYFPTQFTNNFYSLVPFGGTAVAGKTSSYFVKAALQLKNVANITNIFNMVEPDYPLTELLQVRIGIAPSPLRIFSYYPSDKALDNISDNMSWSTLSGLLNFGYLDGFNSPIDNPSEGSEHFFIPKIEPVFGFLNPTAVQITPLLRFYMNQLTVYPVNDQNMVKKIFDRVVPSKIVSLGALQTGLKIPQQIFPTRNGHYVKPLSLDASVQDIANAGYREGF